MNIWKKKTWSPLDIVLLKWSCILFGAVFGAFFPELIRSNLLLIIAVIILLAAKPTISYLMSSERKGK